MLLRVIAVASGAAVVVLVLWDAFETIVLPREVGRRTRLARGYYVLSWAVWRRVARLRRPGPRREAFLGLFGPLSLLVLLQLWLFSLVLGFGFVHWGLRTPLDIATGEPTLATYHYFSGTTFLTLGLGDIAPTTAPGRFLTVVEAGAGLAFLALLIGYVPVIYQAFSRREVPVALLSARSGSPPTAVGLLSHYRTRADSEALERLLERLELWVIELGESTLSYPVLATYRSQRRGRSWLQGVTLVLDTCSLLLASQGVEDEPGDDGRAAGRVRTDGFEMPLVAAELAFDAAAQLVVDVCAIYFGRRSLPVASRLAEEDEAELCRRLTEVGVTLLAEPGALEVLRELRSRYEPGVLALSEVLVLDVPSWVPGTLSRETGAGVGSASHLAASAAVVDPEAAEPASTASATSATPVGSARPGPGA